MSRFPALFLSHGAPTLAIDDSPAHHFLKGLGPELGRPQAILVVSAHWETNVPATSAAAQPETIYDFRGFPQALYQVRYPAPGAPALAEAAARRLIDAGLPAAMHPSRGLDHGAWVPLVLMYPDADIPVTQLSVQPQQDAAHHRRVGEALRGLRDEGVMILASGSITHNMQAYFRGEYENAGAWVKPFVDWMADKVAAQDSRALDGWRAQAPFAVRNHPDGGEEHLLPLFVAAGASDRPGRRIFGASQIGDFNMDCYRFD